MEIKYKTKIIMCVGGGSVYERYHVNNLGLRTQFPRFSCRDALMLMRSCLRARAHTHTNVIDSIPWGHVKMAPLGQCLSGVGKFSQWLPKACQCVC